MRMACQIVLGFAFGRRLGAEGVEGVERGEGEGEGGEEDGGRGLRTMIVEVEVCCGG